MRVVASTTHVWICDSIAKGKVGGRNHFMETVCQSAKTQWQGLRIL